MDEMVKWTETKKWTMHYHFDRQITNKGGSIDCTCLVIQKVSRHLKLQDTEPAY